MAMPRLLIDIPTERLSALCRKHGVKTLWLFGSAVAMDGEPTGFDPERSDVDMLVEFVENPPNGRAMAFFTLERELAELLQRPVDLAEPGGLRNPVVRESIFARRVPIYAAA